MKQLDLFGNEKKEKIVCATTKSSTYEDFIAKFEDAKTTDDCFTPPVVFGSVVDYVFETYNLPEETKIIRPFFPGGDYENTEYHAGSVVIDNPPFSIFTKIVRFYTDNNIPFFLFANHLTLFNVELTGLQYIVCGAVVKYANGAKVNTSFITNIHDDKSDVIVLAGILKRKIEKAQKVERAENLVKVVPNPHVMNSARIAKYIRRGSDLAIKAEHMQRCKWPKLFGGGFVIDTATVVMLEEIHEEIPEEIPEEIKQVIRQLDEKNL